MKGLIFKKKGIVHTPIKFWEFQDGLVIAIYQGERGARPDLDFIVKYLAPQKRLRAPSHTHWIVDLLLKSQFEKTMVRDFIKLWIDLYDQIRPFQMTSERNGYVLMYNHIFKRKFEELNQYGEYNVDFLSALIELFIKCEKQTPKAFMFKNLMNLVLEYCEGKKDFYQVISHSKRV